MLLPLEIALLTIQSVVHEIWWIDDLSSSLFLAFTPIGDFLENETREYIYLISILQLNGYPRSSHLNISFTGQLFVIE